MDTSCRPAGLTNDTAYQTPVCKLRSRATVLTVPEPAQRSRLDQKPRAPAAALKPASSSALADARWAGDSAALTANQDRRVCAFNRFPPLKAEMQKAGAVPGFYLTLSRLERSVLERAERPVGRDDHRDVPNELQSLVRAQVRLHLAADPLVAAKV